MQQTTGAQAAAAMSLVAILAIVVPLFGIFLIPVVLLVAAGRGLVRAMEAIAEAVRPAPAAWPRMTTAGLAERLRARAS
jgi:hypothetical protein